MDQEIRNKLRNVVTQCRRLLEISVSQELEGKYGIFAKKDQVTADPNATMTHLTEEEQAARKDILDHFGHIKARGFKPKEALDQLVREIAFTHLNRLCAYKMMEAREVYVGGQKFREAVSRGIHSNGVKFYLADHPDEERLFNTGHQDVAYRHFLDWLGSLLSDEIGVLFSPNDPANRLYPRQKTLDEVLDLLNGGGIKADEPELRESWPKIWSQDETIGWVYQYFTPKELRDQARKESTAPRNSYELAFRNQFFTPRYVVEFLTDNTLGRIWYEMRKGETKLNDQCRYLVRRPTEVFLNVGEQPPEPSADRRDDLSKEELIKLPAYIPHRPKKDPRELKVLDPACGSGHFLLYCFDLLLTIYEEAYADPELGPALQRDYPTLEDLRRELPRLILAQNIHGIDIDLRCSQVAALALWLRCQRAYQKMGLKNNRPTITRSNFVCAEPMPGEEPMLKDFVAQLEPKVLGQIVEVVFDKMKLAGEAGSLLKIEEDISDTVASAKKQWVRDTIRATDKKGRALLFTEAEMDRLAGKPQRPSPFDLSDISDAQFFEQAEAKVIQALHKYAEKAQNSHKLQRRLFTEDAVRGFAFVDLCHQAFDVVLMNPPFGDPTPSCRDFLGTTYEESKTDLFAAFVHRGRQLANATSMVGAITSRSGFYLPTLEVWRKELLGSGSSLPLFVDLGIDVLDSALVETAMYCVTKANSNAFSLFFSVLISSKDDKADTLQRNIASINSDGISTNVYAVHPNEFAAIPGTPFCYWANPAIVSLFRLWKPIEEEIGTAKQGLATTDDFRFLRCWFEVLPKRSGRSAEDTLRDKVWIPYSKGGEFAPYFADLHLYVNWHNDGNEIKQAILSDPNTTHWSRRVAAREYYFRAGLTWAERTDLLMLSPLPAGTIFGVSGKGFFAHSQATSDLMVTAACIGSSLFRYLSRLVVGGGEMRPKYQAGSVQRLPFPPLAVSEKEALCRLQRENVLASRFLCSYDETSLCFDVRSIFSDQALLVSLRNAADQSAMTCAESILRISERQKLIDKILFDVAKVPSEARHNMSKEVEFTITAPELTPETRSRLILSFSVGSVLGRWDVSFTLGQIPASTLRDPFDPLPACSIAMLQGPDGLPVSYAADCYPLRISWSGILVDDSEHADDIVGRVREVIELIWKDQAETIEKEACEILGITELRVYFRKPGKGGFWDDHVSRYSKSRRKAPIYWLLQSSKKNYALWLDYHRLDKDLLFKALVNYVEPKMRLETSRLELLRS